MSRGKFITVEGVDGAGKTTHVQWIADYLREAGFPTVVTHEPGGTLVGEALRALILQHTMDPYTELLLSFAARRESVTQILEPSLSQGVSVVSDRFTEATYAYQGGGRALPVEWIDHLCGCVHPHLTPDVTFFLDLPLEYQSSRLKERCDRFENEDLGFFMRVSDAYHRLASERSYIRTVPAHVSEEEIQKHLRCILDELIQSWVSEKV